MKKINRIFYSGLGLSILLLLSGCVQTKNGQPTGDGWVWNYLVAPMANVIKFFATEQGLGFGMGIIVVTLIVRLLILPLGLYQSWNTTYHAEKRAYLKPYLEPHQKRLQEAQTQEEKLAAQQALMAAQKELGVSMFGGIGCLPILIQMPFFSALFYAARYTDGIAGSHFMGIALDQPSILLTAIVGVLYFIQSALTLVGVDEEQKKQMKSMMYMSPLMIVVFSFTSPAGVTLYWVVGGFMAILQQLIVIYVIRPIMEKRVAAEFEKNPPKMTKTTVVKDVTPKMTSAIETPRPKKQKRNAGKQNKRS